MAFIEKQKMENYLNSQVCVLHKVSDMRLAYCLVSYDK